ncbi:hypothetical protein BGP_1974 [Beggiatoa sp. PS]|nr:hypothetical protein BGP_1974 [Beggiatoa sp. PS]
MRLECENKWPIKNVSKKQVIRALKGLRSYGPSSFAVLNTDDGSYIQVAGGGVTCLLEKRETSTGKHYRAYHDFPSTPFPDGTILSFSGSRIVMRNNEWFNIEQIIEVFVTLLNQQNMPEFVKWQDITEIFKP